MTDSVEKPTRTGNEFTAYSYETVKGMASQVAQNKGLEGAAAKDFVREKMDAIITDYAKDRNLPSDVVSEYLEKPESFFDDPNIQEELGEYIIGS